MMKHRTVTRRHQKLDQSQQGMEDLRELIAALDARVPRLERSGEVEIAREAAVLRHEAVERIARLERIGAVD